MVETIQYLESFPDLLTSQVGERILMTLEAAGAQNKEQLYLAASMAVKDLKFHSPTVMRYVDSAIATLLDNHLIEKWEYQEDDGAMVDYYDLPEEKDDDKF